MKLKKSFSFIFLILLLLISFSVFVACGEQQGESPITNIIISTSPKTNYYLGDLFDVGDGKITVYYENGETKTVPLDINMVSNFDSSIEGEQSLSVRYETQTVYLVVNVTIPPIYSLEISSTDHKTEYVVGDQLDVTDMAMLVTYTNGRTATVAVQEDMVGGFSSTAPGEKILIVSYQNHTCNLLINVSPKSVTNVQLRSPTKARYIVGDTVDFEGGSMYVSFNDNSYEYRDLATLIENREASVIVSGEESTLLTKSQMTCTVTVYYLGKEHPFVIRVEDVKATGAVVTKDLDNQVMGAERFKLDSGEITVTYNNGDVKKPNFASPDVSVDTSGCDLSSVGDYIANVSVGGITFKYTIHVVSPTPSELIITAPSNTVYQGQTVDVTEWKYSIKMDNDQYQRIGDKAEFFIQKEMLLEDPNDFDVYQTGDHTLHFREASTGLTAEVTITVLAKEIDKLEIIVEGKTVYSEGDSLDLSDIYAQALYNNGDVGQRQAVTMDMLRNENGEDLDVEQLLADAGEERKAEKTIYVYYADRTFDTSGIGAFAVLLVKKASSIELLESPKTDFILGEEIDKSDFQIKINYAEGTTATVSGENGALESEEWRFVLYKNDAPFAECDSLSETGEYTVYIYYGEDVYLTYGVNVSNEIVSISLDAGHIGFVTENTLPDLSLISLYIVRENGSRESIPVTSDMIGEYMTPNYRYTGTEYISAYLDANILASTAYENDFWVEISEYLLSAEDDGYAAAGEYDIENDYVLNLPKMYSGEKWDRYKHNFFVDENGTKADAYEEGTLYYVNNCYTLAFEYKGHTAFAVVTVEAKQITEISVAEYREEYSIADTDWDTEQLVFAIQYNNGTYGLVSGAIGTDLTALTRENGILSYVVNGMTYFVELGVTEDNAFALYDFDDFKQFDTYDMLKVGALSVRVKDATNGSYILSDAFEVYCFEELIEKIDIIAGIADATSLNAFGDQSVYLNEGKDLREDGFVLDGEQRYSVATNLYVRVTGKEGTIRNMTLAEAQEASPLSFLIESGFTNAIHQTITVHFLRKQATFALVLRPNIITSVTVTGPSEGKIQVIEKMSIDPADITIIVGYEDADGVSAGEKTIDFRQATCEGYSKTMDWNFGSAAYVDTKIYVGYGDFPDKTELDLTVLRKNLVSITLTSMPKLVYVEDPTGNTKMDANAYAGGKVSLRFDNGTTQVLDLTNGSLNKNPGNFDAEVMEELSNGAQKQHTVYVSYNYFGTVKQTSYNVVIVDRKYVTIEYDASLGYDRTLVCEYGAMENLFPMPKVLYYENYSDDIAMTLARGENNTIGYYYVCYRDEQGNLSEEWPTEVGTYSVVVSYFAEGGDANNNAFLDDSAKIRITKKELAIILEDFVVDFGDALDGDNETAFVGSVNWHMTGVTNGLAEGQAYCYDDTDEDVIAEIKFYIYSAASIKQEFAVFAMGDVKKLVISIPVGEYKIRPLITLVENANYSESALIRAAESKLTVRKRDIFIAAEDAQKTYGQADPEFRFRIYDGKDVASQFTDEELESLTSQQIMDRESPSFVPIGNKNGIYYVFGQTNYSGNGVFVDAENIMYTDRSTRDYHLSRSSDDTNTAGAEHKIYSGANTILSNYNVRYFGNLLCIDKATLPIKADSVTKYFGMDVFIENRAKGTTYAPQTASSVVYGDVFGSLINNYFDDDGQIFFYRASTGEFTNEVNGYYDGWYVLYKNTSIYTDRACTDVAGIRLENAVFTIRDIEYRGNYFAFPIAMPIGTYYAVADISELNLTNYIPSILNAEGELYTYTIDIRKTNVSINVKSIVGSGNGSIKDQDNAQNGRLLSSYFVGEEFNVEKIDRATFDTDLDQVFKNNILRVTYSDNDGNELNYRLSDNVLVSQFTFQREDKAFNTGIHTVYAVESDGVCYNISLQSVTDDEGETPYVDMFYNYWRSVYTLSETESRYGENAYIVMLPEFIKIDFGNNISTDEQGRSIFGLSETYAAKNRLTLNGYATLDGASYRLFGEHGIGDFPVENVDSSVVQTGTLDVGTYTVTATYSFFDTDTKNYLYMGNSMILESSAAAYILEYIYNGTDYADSDAESKPMVYNSRFAYEITPIELDFEIGSFSENYMEAEDFTGYTVSVTIPGNSGSILPVDFSETDSNNSLKLYFDISVLYNEKTEEQTFKSIGLLKYTLNGSEFSSGDFALLNAGTYTIKVSALSSNNYVINSTREGEVVIQSINIPVYIQYADEDDDEHVISMDYQASAGGVNPIDTVWKRSEDPRNADYCFITTTCFIVKQYYKNEERYTCNLGFVPSIIVSTAQRSVNENGEEEWNYPKNVNRDEDGNVIGYPITARVVNTEYVNYNVVFVYKNENSYKQFEDGQGYTLLIKPKEAKLYGFGNLNKKTYDGTVASVRATDSSLTITGDYNGDPIDRNGISFTFERPASEMYVGEYRYLQDANDAINVGKLKVRIQYADADGNMNYNIVFADQEVQYYDEIKGYDPNYGVYEIEPGEIVFDLKNVDNPWVSKQYDGNGFVSTGNITGNAKELTLYKEDQQATPIDSLEGMYYRFVPIWYKTPESYDDLINDKSKLAEAIDDSSYTTQIPTDYPVGFYGIRLVGLYKIGENQYASFADGDERQNWLSWNYRFRIENNNNTSYHGCDGIYYIAPRDVYIVVNPVERGDGILTVAENDMNAPVFTEEQKTYTYYIPYDGYYYKGVPTVAELDSGKYISLQNTLNGTPTVQNKTLSYAFYVYDKTKGQFVNINYVDALQPTLPANMFSVTSPDPIITSDNLPISASLTAFSSANTNLNVINAGTRHSIDFRISPREIQLKLTLVRKGSDKAQMVYGTEFETGDGLVFRFEYDGTYSSSGMIDPKLESVSTIINQIINQSEGSVYLKESDTDAKRITVRFSNATITQLDGINYVIVGGTSVNKLAANKYDSNNNPIKRYETGADGLSTDSTRYSFKVVSTEFVVTRKEVLITGIERSYFDKETDHYSFIVSEDGINAEQANRLLDEEDEYHQIVKDYLEDATSISDRVGTWANNETEKNYYVTIPVAKFNIIDSNYIPKTETTADNFDLTNWTGESIRTKAYVYLPLTIRKKVVTIQYIVSGEISYGTVIDERQADIAYNGLPDIKAQGIYGHLNHITQETVQETNVFYTLTQSGEQIALSDERNAFMNTVSHTLLYDRIYEWIALSNVQSAKYEVNLDNPEFISGTPLFDNYEIEWSNIEYKIIKKNIDITISAKTPTYNVGTVSTFSGRWSERNDYFYAGEGLDQNDSRDKRLGYTIAIPDFSINNVALTTLSEKIAKIMDATYNAETGVITRANTNYENTFMFLTDILDYKIFKDSAINKGDADEEAISGGTLRYIGLYGLSSNNFEIRCVRTPIMLYPEITGIGSNTYVATENGEEVIKYANLITDAEASKSGVFIAEDGTVTGLSILVRYNFIGLGESGAIAYVDTNRSDDYSVSNYYGMRYDRRLTIQCVNEYSSFSYSKDNLQNGDRIAVKLYIDEVFYQDTDYEYKTTIESNCVMILLKDVGNSETGHTETIVSKGQNEALRLSSDSTLNSLDEYLSKDSATYYLSNTSGVDYERIQDIINMRIRMMPIDVGEANRTFEIILYENDFGRLKVGFASQKVYLRMEYNDYYIAAMSNYPDGELDASVMYYTFESEMGGATEETEDDKPIPRGAYYDKVGNGYVATTDTVFVNKKIYYKKMIVVGPDSSAISSYYVDFSLNEISVEDLRLVDGKNHEFSIYLDKVGSFDNVSTAIDPSKSYLMAIRVGDTIPANSLYEYVNGEYVYTEDTAIVEGKTYYDADHVGMMAEIVTGRTVRRNTYYEFNNGQYALTQDTVFADGKTYYVLSEKTITTVSADRIMSVRMRLDNTDYLFTYTGEPYSYVYTQVRNGGTGYQSYDTIQLYETVFFNQAGKTAVSFNNIKMMISKYTLQTRKISTASIRNVVYIANVLFWPAAEEGDVTYVSACSAGQIGKLLSEIGNITVSGGEEALTAYKYASSGENAIQTYYSVYDIANNNIGGTKSDPGMYTLTYNSSYVYGDDMDSLGTSTVRLIVTSEPTYAQLTLGSSDITPSEPKTLSDGYYFTPDMKKEMGGNVGLTYVFDTVSLRNTTQSGNIWIYFKLTDANFRNLYVSDDELGEVAGVALRLRVVNEVVGGKTKTVAYASVIYSQQTGTSVYELTYWSGSETKIIFEDGVLNIVKIDIARVNTDWETGSAIDKITSGSGSRLRYQDTVITFRFYQHTASGTTLAFEEYVREGFGHSNMDNSPISRGEFESHLFKSDSAHYMGLGLTNVTMRLVDAYKDNDVVTDVDYVKYGKVFSEGTLSGSFVARKTAMDESGKVYMATDRYDVPLAYNGNAVNIRFSASGDADNGSFIFYFAMNTPYYTTENYADMRRQRGMMLEYRNNRLYAYFYKYNVIYRSQFVRWASGTAGEEINLFDGEEHTISIYIDTSAFTTNSGSLFPPETYDAVVVIDNLGEAHIKVPVGNNMGYLESNQNQPVEDEEQTLTPDLMFLKGTYYMGFEVVGDASLVVQDCVAFDQVNIFGNNG